MFQIQPAIPKHFIVVLSTFEQQLRSLIPRINVFLLKLLQKRSYRVYKTGNMSRNIIKRNKGKNIQNKSGFIANLDSEVTNGFH